MARPLCGWARPWRHGSFSLSLSSRTPKALSIPKLIAGAFVVESIFAWPGVGRLCITAIFNRDFPVIQAYVLVMAVLFVVFNLASDIWIAWLDPRERQGV